MDISDDKYYTVEEYFSIVEDSEEMYEYHNGKLCGMAGGTATHNAISLNTAVTLHNTLSERDCMVYNSDQQVSINSLNRYLYPDVSVVCGEQEFEDEKEMRLKNPILILEVLSESTKAYGKNAKFLLYRNIPSFQEYLLIYPDRTQIDSYYREDSGLWRISSGFKLEDTIHLYSINVDLNLSDVYNKIKGLKGGMEVYPFKKKT